MNMMNMVLKMAMPMITDDAVQNALSGLEAWLKEKNATLPDAGSHHMLVVEPDLTTGELHIRVWTRTAEGAPIAMIHNLPLSNITANDIKNLTNAFTADKK